MTPSGDYHISKQILDRFFAVGLNYDKANIAVRGAFAVPEKENKSICESAKVAGLRSVFVLSTCNRTEMYGFAASSDILVDLLTKHCRGTKKDLLQYGYVKCGEDAIKHLYKVAAGLDSQILGDYEILGQIKQAVDISKSADTIGPIMDRVLNFAFQSSKKIKTDTGLSNGTVSVSFAAINVLQSLPNLEGKKLLLIGTGKFGRNVCSNLKNYLRGVSLTVTNRTDAIAKDLSEELNINFCLYSERETAIKNADVVLVCTNANTYTVTPEMANTDKVQLFLDLSVPANVDPKITDMATASLINVDEISATILDKTLTTRKAEVPKAISIIERYFNDFLQWVKEYRYVTHLKTWREKLVEITPPHTCEFADDPILLHDVQRTERAQKALKQLAINLKQRDDKGCQFINSINDYLQAP